MTPRQKKLIKQYLTADDIKTLKKEFSQFGQSTIYAKLTGDRPLNSNDDEFILRAIELAELRKRKKQKISKKLNSLAA